jgi:dTDP-4-dehydrorhamnose reductase
MTEDSPPHPETFYAQTKRAAEPAIPAEPSNPVITVSADLAFRKHQCENTP